MIDRRRFLRHSAALLPGAALGPGVYAAATHVPLGVQLYTVREQAEKDLPSVLKQIRAIGYEEVELYWNVYNRPAKELRSLIAGSGLSAPSGHFNYEGLSGKFEYAKELGVGWMVCPMLPETERNSLEGFHRAAVQFNKWGSEARKLGMRFAFHNHNYEFRRFSGTTTGFDVLLRETDPELVWLEMDCYWIRQAGYSPVFMLNQLGRRVRLLHLKDRLADYPPSVDMEASSQHFTELGRGSIRWRPLLALARHEGIEHYFVEQDTSDKPPIESLRISYQYLRGFLS